MHQWEGTSGVVIAGDSWGPDGGPLVLLQHGGGQTRHAWKGAGETLGAAGYHAIAFDARGHGDSDLGARRRLRPGRDGRRPGPLCWSSWATGGPCWSARRWAAASASSPSARTTSTPPRWCSSTSPRASSRTASPRSRRSWSQRPDGFDSLDEVADAIASYQPHRSRPQNLDGLAKNVRLGEDGRYHWHWDPTFRTGPARPRQARRPASRPAPATSPCRRCWCAAVCPTCSARRARRLPRAVPGSEYVNVTGAGHMVAGDRNDVFAGAVIEFLTRTVPVERPPVSRRTSRHPHHAGPPGDVLDVP